MWQDFKAFAMRGNVLDLAVAVIIGGAFGKIISSLVEDIIMPLIGLLMGGVSFADLTWTFNEAVVSYGVFLQSIVDFLIIVFSIFIFIRIITNMKKKEEAAPEPAPPEPSPEVVLLQEIRDLLSQKK